MEKWNDDTIPHKKSLYGKVYLVGKKSMQKTWVLPAEMKFRSP